MRPPPPPHVGMLFVALGMLFPGLGQSFYNQLLKFSDTQRIRFWCKYAPSDI